MKRRTRARRVVSRLRVKKRAPPKKSFVFVCGVQSLGRSESASVFVFNAAVGGVCVCVCDGVWAWVWASASACDSVGWGACGDVDSVSGEGFVFELERNQENSILVYKELVSCSSAYVSFVLTRRLGSAIVRIVRLSWLRIEYIDESTD